jgi:hypothetical protein
MKKGRPGTRIEVLCAPAEADRLARLLLMESTTIGVRRHAVSRRSLPREMREVRVGEEVVRLKVVTLPDGSTRAKPEFDDVRRVAAAQWAAASPASREALQALSQRVEGNLLAAVQEIEKVKLHELPQPIGLDDLLGVLEDAAHAHGAGYQSRPAGSLGHLGSFSFQSSKNLTSGEGGIITTNDEALAERCRSLHNCGRIPSACSSDSIILRPLCVIPENRNAERRDHCCNSRPECGRVKRAALPNGPPLHHQH